VPWSCALVVILAFPLLIRELPRGGHLAEPCGKPGTLEHKRTVDYLSANGNISQLTYSETHQQKVAAKIRTMTLLKMIKAMVNYATLSIFFLGYAPDIAIYLLNLDSSKFVLNTLVELWLGRKPSMKYLDI
jgi:hypothetical protein